MYLKNASWLFLDRLVRIFGGLLVGIWIARYLGPGNYGILNYSLAYVAFFQLFVVLGLDQIVVRELVKYPKRSNYILGTAFGLKFIGSILGMISVSISLLFFQTDHITKLVIFILTIGIFFQSVDVISYFFEAKIISKFTVIARSLSFLFSSLLSIFFILNEYSVIYFALSQLVYIILSSLFLLIIYQNNSYKIKQWKFCKKLAVKLLQFGWPLALSVFLISIHTKIDQVMIGNILDIEQTGIYSVAVKMSEAWLFFPAILVSTFMPYFISLRESDNELYHYRLIQLYSLMFWMGIFVGLFFIMFGESIIVFLFGKAYVDAYIALVFNIWCGIFISQGLARGIWMIGENLQIYRLYNNIIVVILNITLNLMLIPKYGIAGAAIATLTTQALGIWLVSFIWKPLRQSNLTLIKSINPIYLIRLNLKK